MTATTTVIDDKHTQLELDFSDENVTLTGSTLVAGDESAARAYAPFFEADLRRNNAELFPQPEMPVTPEMEGI